jgi:hypothetical protein
VPQYSIKLCTYDPTIIDAFERLRKNRKQAAFTHEALKYFFSTDKGGQVLLLMEGNASVVSSVTPPMKSEWSEVPNEIHGTATEITVVPQSETRSILGCILE